jgi:hypothetical protein
MMIDKNNIEAKNSFSTIPDFSIELPELISKIQFIGTSLINTSYEMKNIIPKDEYFYGAGLLLNEIVEDLEAIDKALSPIYAKKLSMISGGKG